MSDLEFENLSQSGDISCGSGMYKECIGTSCKCVEGSKTDYTPWILGGVGVIIIGGLAVSAYRAYKGMPEPGVVWAQGREPKRKSKSARLIIIDHGNELLNVPYSTRMLEEFEDVYHLTPTEQLPNGTEIWHVVNKRSPNSAKFRVREPARIKGGKDYYHFYVEYPATYYFDPPGTVYWSHKNVDQEIEEVVGKHSAGTGMGSNVRDLSFYFDTLQEAKAAYKRLENYRELKSIIKLDHKIIQTRFDGFRYTTVRKIVV